MIIVAGAVYCRPGTRDDFVQGSLEAVKAARALDDCLDFAVSADPIEHDRVNIFREVDFAVGACRFWAIESQRR